MPNTGELLTICKQEWCYFGNGLFRAAKNPELTRNPETLRAHKIKQGFFTPAVVSDIGRKLVGHYFILTQDELNEWDADPEAFSNDECGDSWKYSLRVSIKAIKIFPFFFFGLIACYVLKDNFNKTVLLIMYFF